MEVMGLPAPHGHQRAGLRQHIPLGTHWNDLHSSRASKELLQQPSDSAVTFRSASLSDSYYTSTNRVLEHYSANALRRI